MVGVNMEKTSNESEKMFFLIKIPYNIVKYFCKGVYTTTFILLDIIKHFIKYFLWGYVTISYFVYRLLSLPFKLLGKIFKYQTKDEAREAMLKRRAERAEAIRKQKEQDAIAKQRKIVEKQNKKEQEFIKNEEQKHKEEERIKKEQSEAYVNNNVKIQQPPRSTLIPYISHFRARLY